VKDGVAYKYTGARDLADLVSFSAGAYKIEEPLPMATQADYEIQLDRERMRKALAFLPTPQNVMLSIAAVLLTIIVGLGYYCAPSSLEEEEEEATTKQEATKEEVIPAAAKSKAKKKGEAVVQRPSKAAK
jgi:hypothetical protein